MYSGELLSGLLMVTLVMFVCVVHGAISQPSRSRNRRQPGLRVGTGRDGGTGDAILGAPADHWDGSASGDGNSGTNGTEFAGNGGGYGGGGASDSWGSSDSGGSDFGGSDFGGSDSGGGGDAGGGSSD